MRHHLLCLRFGKRGKGCLSLKERRQGSLPARVVRYEHKHMYIFDGRFAALNFVSLSLVEIGVSVVK
jgi:hypothetical protein